MNSLTHRQTCIYCAHSLLLNSPRNYRQRQYAESEVHRRFCRQVNVYITDNKTLDIVTMCCDVFLHALTHSIVCVCVYVVLNVDKCRRVTMWRNQVTQTRSTATCLRAWAPTQPAVPRRGRPTCHTCRSTPARSPPPSPPSAKTSLCSASGVLPHPTFIAIIFLTPAAAFGFRV